MNYGYRPNDDLRPVDVHDIMRSKSQRMLRSDVALPSQHQAYAVCVEFAKNWFLEKFDDDYFNSIYVNTAHSFDEFRKFAHINEQMKKTNPLLAIIPSIDMTHNRQWVDAQPEIPMLLRRSRIEGTFFNDYEKHLHAQLIFKTILMNFVFKIRLDTRAEELDMVEFIKLKHRAGWTESRDIALDIHVPKQIILQIAYDNGFKIGIDGQVEEPMKLLEYLNSHSYIPFLYKLRCSTGNKEFFLKVPNCCAHIKSEFPSMDEGERQDMITTNYNIDFQVEIEMTAPYCYTYFSQCDHNYIIPQPIHNNIDKIAVMSAIKTTMPKMDDNGWELFTTTEYDIDDEDIGKPIEIDFNEFFNGHDLAKIINYTKAIAVSPAIFINFVMFNNGYPVKYEIDWNTMKCKIGYLTNVRTVIGIYCDKKYINDTLIYLDNLNKKSTRVE